MMALIRRPMSLIPSESYSFPDHFTKTVTPSRKPKKEEPPPIRARKEPMIVPLPNPRNQPAAEIHRPTAEPIRDNGAAAAPNPALRRANARPPRIPDPTIGKQAVPSILKPKPGMVIRAPAMGPGPLTEVSAPVPGEPAPGSK